MNPSETRIEDLRSAARLYAFLSRGFLKEPSEDELRELADGELGKNLRRMGYDLLGGLKS